MTSLVTGANGFVGAAIVRALLARGEGVRALAGARVDSVTRLGKAILIHTRRGPAEVDLVPVAAPAPPLPVGSGVVRPRDPDCGHGR